MISSGIWFYNNTFCSFSPHETHLKSFSTSLNTYWRLKKCLKKFSNEIFFIDGRANIVCGINIIYVYFGKLINNLSKLNVGKQWTYRNVNNNIKNWKLTLVYQLGAFPVHQSALEILFSRERSQFTMRWNAPPTYSSRITKNTVSLPTSGAPRCSLMPTPPHRRKRIAFYMISYCS